jgi:WD40 repeat protein
VPRREQPLESGDKVLLTFARDLRLLREQAGGPTYRQLAVRAHYSAAALSEAASGRKLPSRAVTLAYVTACDGDVTAWEERWWEVAAATNPVESNGHDGEDAPYVGLAAFQPGDADRFFGRDALVDDLVKQVREHRFVGVIGASGSGKSSVLRAGLMARANPAVVLTPGAHPIEECAVHLAALLDESPAVLLAEFTADPINLHLRIRQALADKPDDLILVVDQFEELFTLCHNDYERDWLITALTAAATAASSRTRVVLGVRSDFHDRCETLVTAQVIVNPMNAEELRLAITEPAIQVGCRLETALVSRLISISANQPGCLPAISHALLETWRRRRGATLTLAGYEATGGVFEAIAHTAESVYSALDGRQRDIAKHLLLRLCGTEDTKRRMGRDELDYDNPDTGVVLERLISARLVTLDRDSVEIAHERLIAHWPRLREWLGEDRSGHRILRELTEATNAWQSLDRDSGALYRGVRLSRTEAWAAGNDHALTARERQFLYASLDARASEEATAVRTTRRLRRLVGLLTALLVFTAAAVGFAIQAQQTAADQRDAALAQRAVHDAAALRRTDPSLAGQLALAAYRLDPTAETRGSVLSGALRLYGHRGPVRSLWFSPDGRTLVTASQDGTTRIWAVTAPYQARQVGMLRDGGENVTDVTMSPNGRIVATTSADSTVRLWDFLDPQGPRQIGRMTGGLSAAFNSDGSMVATGSLDRQIRVYDVTSSAGPELLAAIADENPAFAVAFSPRRPILAAGSNRDALLFDISDRRNPRRLSAAHGDGLVNSLEFAPDDRTLAMAGGEESARLFDVTDPLLPKPVAELRDPGANVTSVGYVPKSHLLATASDHGTLRLWDSTTPYATLTGDFGSVSAISPSSDGRTIAIASDATVRVIDLDLDRAVVQICRLPGRITGAEWAEHFPGIDFRPPCP